MRVVTLSYYVNGDGVWPDLDKKKFFLVPHVEMARLSNGAGVVAIRIDLPDGTSVIGQCDLASFQKAAQAFAAAHHPIKN